VALGALVIGRRLARPALWGTGALVAVAVFLGPSLGALRPRSEVSQAQDAVDLGGAVLWRASTGHAVLVLGGDAAGATVLRGLRDAGVARLDLVIVRSAGPAAAEALDVVDDRIEVGSVWAPQGHAIPRAEVPVPGTVERGGLRIRVVRSAPRLEIAVTALR